MTRCHCELLKIPPRSHDLNPIENIFHIVSKKLEKDALNKGITHESYKEFCDRVQRTISGISQELIDKTIQSEWSHYRHHTKQRRTTKILTP